MYIFLFCDYQRGDDIYNFNKNHVQIIYWNIHSRTTHPLRIIYSGIFIYNDKPISRCEKTSNHFDADYFRPDYAAFIIIFETRINSSFPCKAALYGLEICLFGRFQPIGLHRVQIGFIFFKGYHVGRRLYKLVCTCRNLLIHLMCLQRAIYWT